MIGESLVPIYILLSTILMFSFYFMFQKKLGKGFFFTGLSTSIWCIASLGMAGFITTYAISPLPTQQAMGMVIACLTLCSSCSLVWCT